MDHFGAFALATSTQPRSTGSDVAFSTGRGRRLRSTLLPGLRRLHETWITACDENCHLSSARTRSRGSIGNQPVELECHQSARCGTLGAHPATRSSALPPHRPPSARICSSRRTLNAPCRSPRRGVLCRPGTAYFSFVVRWPHITVVVQG